MIYDFHYKFPSELLNYWTSPYALFNGKRAIESIFVGDKKVWPSTYQPIIFTATLGFTVTITAEPGLVRIYSSRGFVSPAYVDNVQTSWSDTQEVFAVPYTTAGAKKIELSPNCTLREKAWIMIIGPVTNVSFYQSGTHYAAGPISIETPLHLTTATNLFRDCKWLEYVCPTVFQHAGSVTSFNGAFQDCTRLWAIPPGIFAYCTEMTDAGWLFYQTGGVLGLSLNAEHLFDNCQKIKSFRYTFYRNSTNGGPYLTGSAPALWERDGAVGTRCFFLQTQLSNYVDIPSGWK